MVVCTECRMHDRSEAQACHTHVAPLHCQGSTLCLRDVNANAALTHTIGCERVEKCDAPWWCKSAWQEWLLPAASLQSPNSPDGLPELQTT